MRIIALIGSPRKNGNTDIMADEVLRGASDFGASVDKVYLDDYNISPIAEVCDNTAQREDSRADDDFPALLERFLEADVAIFATPVYWFGYSAQLKCFEKNNPPPDGKGWGRIEQTIGNYYWGAHYITSDIDILRKFGRLDFRLPIG